MRDPPLWGPPTDRQLMAEGTETDPGQRDSATAATVEKIRLARYGYARPMMRPGQTPRILAARSTTFRGNT